MSGKGRPSLVAMGHGDGRAAAICTQAAKARGVSMATFYWCSATTISANSPSTCRDFTPEGVEKFG